MTTSLKNAVFGWRLVVPLWCVRLDFKEPFKLSPVSKFFPKTCSEQKLTHFLQQSCPESFFLHLKLNSFFNSAEKPLQSKTSQRQGDSQAEPSQASAWMQYQVVFARSFVLLGKLEVEMLRLKSQERRNISQRNHFVGPIRWKNDSHDHFVIRVWNTAENAWQGLKE